MKFAVQQSMQQQMLANVYQAATTSDHHSVEIAANIASLAEAEAAFSNGAEGIGLFRTEMSFMDRESAPDYHELAELYSQVIQVAQGKPVIFRTFDIGGDKPVDYMSIGEEENPVSRLPGGANLSALSRPFRHAAQGYPQRLGFWRCQIMIPMIANVDEVIWCREVLEEVKVRCVMKGWHSTTASRSA